MAQKPVSFKVAKALKKAGYPQRGCDLYYSETGTVRCCSPHAFTETYACPTYLSTWLWLWREKGIMVDVSRVEDCVELAIYTEDLVCLYLDDQVYPDPEEAIIAGINHLVSNKLIR